MSGEPDDGWIPWDGSRDFTGDKPIRVRFRNGAVSSEVLPARKWRGKYGQQEPGSMHRGFFPENDFDIVAVKPEG